MVVRPVRIEDASHLLAIYAPIVTDTTISWEAFPPTLEEFSSRIVSILRSGYPWIVLENEGAVLAYAYAAQFRPRYGYRFCCESSVYVSESARGRGFGKQIYSSLIQILKTQGYRTVFGGIALPNDASVHLHESLGFRLEVIFKEIGNKSGHWLDLSLWRLDLDDAQETHLDAPSPFLPLHG